MSQDSFPSRRITLALACRKSRPSRVNEIPRKVKDDVDLFVHGQSLSSEPRRLLTGAPQQRARSLWPTSTKCQSGGPLPTPLPASACWMRLAGVAKSAL